MRRTEFLRRKERAAFQVVLEAYAEIRSVCGSAQVMNLFGRTGGQNAQYSPDAGQHPFRLIDFVVDVERMLKETLTPFEYKDWLTPILNDLFAPEPVYPEPFAIQNARYRRLAARVGRAFIGRGLFPPRQYFQVIKK